jgi:hypothetical protein
MFITRHAAAVALLGVLLGPSPGWAQTTDWRFHRDYFLGPGRNDLMTLCSLGRQVNNMGESFWALESNRQLEGSLEREYGKAAVQAIRAGQAVAMSVACPDVR